MSRRLRASMIAALAVGSGAACGNHSSSSGGASSATTGSTQAASTTQTASTTPSTTRDCWPIVLAHGLGGFKNLGIVEYFYEIPETLTANGFQVYADQVTSISAIESDALELKNQILAQYPDPSVKVNIIGHSMGGLDARYMISVLGMGYKVASLTTIATPHRGSPVADVAFSLTPGPVVDATNVLLGFLGEGLGGAQEMTTSNMENNFNPSVPDDPGVAYFSWAGVADPTGQSGCLLFPTLLPTWPIVDQVEGANDGLVSVTSAQWGSFQGTIPADHLNSCGQLLGHTSPNFDHLAFYLSWCEHLEALGFGP